MFITIDELVRHIDKLIKNKTKVGNDFIYNNMEIKLSIQKTATEHSYIYK